MRRLFVFLTCLVLSSSSLLGAAHAQDTDAERARTARALFKEGMTHADAGAWSEAIDRFQRALALRDSQVIRFNLAHSLEELGRLVEASELMRQVTQDTSADAQLRADASTAIESLSQRIAQLTVHIEGPADGAGIRLDDRELIATQLDVPIPVDPGEHRLVLMRDAEELDAQSVSVSEGAAALMTLHVPLQAAPSDAAATLEPFVPTLLPSPQPAPVRRDESDARHKKRMWWGIGGAAVAAVTIAVVAAVLASSSESHGKTFQGDFEPKSVPVTFGP